MHSRQTDAATVSSRFKKSDASLEYGLPSMNAPTHREELAYHKTLHAILIRFRKKQGW